MRERVKVPCRILVKTVVKAGTVLFGLLLIWFGAGGPEVASPVFYRVMQVALSKVCIGSSVCVLLHDPLQVQLQAVLAAKNHSITCFCACVSSWLVMN